MKAIDIVKKIKNSNLECNGVEERKILDMAINMAITNDGKYMCPFKSLYFNLTNKQIDYIDNLIKNYRNKFHKEPKFSCIVDDKWYNVDLIVYSKYIPGSKKYENKKYLLLYANLE